MAIMAMVTVKNSNVFRLAIVVALLSWFVLSFSTIAGEWQFNPNLSIKETYTDNIDLTNIDPTSSLASQAIVGLSADYQSRRANLTFSADNSNVFYNHDSELNTNYLTLNTEGRYTLWTSGPEMFASANISNSTRNSARNDLGDIISGDTVQSTNYSTGLRYSTNNNTYSLSSSIIYDINEFDDGIGEYNGVTANISTSNGNNARVAFWQLSANATQNTQDLSGVNRTSEQYIINAEFGLITPYPFSPLIRLYGEDFSGDFTGQDQQTTPSWGPGFRWLASPHITIDFSYNFVEDETKSDDYVASSVLWEPSARTSFYAGYSKRFFGKSYDLNIRHTTKRLTTSITYNESLEVFDRNNYERIVIGQFWCPSDISIESISQCFQPIEGDHQLADFYSLEPIESNEFSLNKNLNWRTSLQLARTSFSFDTSATRHEALESKIVDDNMGVSITMNRKISGKSNLTLLAKYDYRIFDKDNSEGSLQKDHYITYSVTYTKSLASSLSTNFSLQHVDRDSSVNEYNYSEVRAIINVTKEF